MSDRCVRRGLAPVGRVARTLVAVLASSAPVGAQLPEIPAERADRAVGTYALEDGRPIHVMDLRDQAGGRAVLSLIEYGSGPTRALFPTDSGDPSRLQARSGSEASWTFAPSIGVGPILENGHFESGGAEALLEIALTRSRLRWSVFAARRGIGVGCADGCDRGGESVGAGLSYLFGGLGVGGGLGVLHQYGGWHLQPHGQLSFVHGIFRTQLRVEVPHGVDGAYLPFLIGLRLPLG